MIDFNKTRQYTLSIRLSTDGFCFAVHNPRDANEYAYQPYRIDPLKSVTANLKEAIASTEMLKHTYGSVNILLADSPYTLVPKEFYAKQYDKELYEYNISSSTTNSDTTLHNEVADEQVTVIFAIETQLHKYITAQYPKAEIYASITPLLSHGVEKSFAANRKYVLLHPRKHSIDIICCENTTPFFVNTFHYHDTADALYYLLNCWSTLGLSQTEDILHIAGEPRHTRALAKELTKFIQNIHIVHPAEEFHSTELARTGEMPFDLQALIVCE